MKKAFIGILLSFVSLFALDDLTVPNRFASQGVIRASEFNQNNDTISVKFNRLNDSLEIKFVRFSDFSDSTIKKIKVDSIRSNPDIDSIKGNPFIDSISSLFANLTTSTIDSLNNRIIIADTIVLGVINADTVHSTKGISATSGNFSSYINVDSLKSTKGISATTGTFTGVVNVDTLKSTKGISATTGTFSGIVSADSIASTKGISGTIGNFSGSVSVGSISISDGVSTTTGTFTGVVNVDSLKSTKGISATTGTFTGNVVSSGDIYTTPLTDISSCETVGWSSFTTKEIYYRKIGKEVTVYFNLKGTADPETNTAWIFGIPVRISSTIPIAYNNCYGKDSTGVLPNGVIARVEEYLIGWSSCIEFKQRYAGGPLWPESGAKEVCGSITFLAEE